MQAKSKKKKKATTHLFIFTLCRVPVSGKDLGKLNSCRQGGRLFSSDSQDHLVGKDL